MYERLPWRFLRFIQCLLPSPDLVIWLRNQPEVIHERKPELTVEQIAAQSIRCERLVDMLPQAFIVETNPDPQVTLGEVRQLIVGHLAQRQAKRSWGRS
jgi:hypothetical protein